MSILSWNCQGAGSIETIRRLKELQRTFFPDFVFLMETKQRFDSMDGLKNSLGYDECITVEPRGLSRGLTVMWKHCYNVEILSKNSRIIDMKVTLGSLVFFISCVYGDPVRDKRQAVWDQLTRIGLRRDEAWVLIGDFNELMSNAEKLGGPARRDSTFWSFRNMSENCKLKEVRSSGNSFSWAGWRDHIWIQCCLDRCFGNDEWYQLFPRAHLDYLSLWDSDHRPLFSFSRAEDETNRGRFYFDKRMLKKPGFEDVVKRGWELARFDLGTVMDRIMRCRKEIARWDL